MKLYIWIAIFLSLLVVSCASGVKLQGAREGLGGPEAYTDESRGVVCYVAPSPWWPIAGGPAMVCMHDVRKVKP